MDTGAYWNDGFSFPHTVMAAAEAAQHRAELEELLERWKDDPSLHASLNDYCRANFHVVSTWGARIARHPAILDLVEPLIGPDILCWMCEIIIKEPGSGKMISMHQDFTYWGMDNSDAMLTAWLALSDATPENGCMQFVRGSHKAGPVTHNDTFADDNLLSRGQEIAVEYNPEDVVCCTLKPGELSLHHSLMFHGSDVNSTDGRRIGIVLRYMSPDMKHPKSSRDYVMVVRGENRSDHFINVPVPESDFSEHSMVLHDRISADQQDSLAEGIEGEFRYVEQTSQ